MTVYYQFGSRHELIEALFDDLSVRGRILTALPAALAQEDPAKALRLFIRAFALFWDSDREVLRKIRGLGRLDPELGAALKERDSYRMIGARVIAQRLAPDDAAPAQVESVAVLLNMLTSFESYDTLTQSVTREAAVDLIEQTCRRALGAAPIPPP